MAWHQSGNGVNKASAAKSGMAASSAWLRRKRLGGNGGSGIISENKRNGGA